MKEKLIMVVTCYCITYWRIQTTCTLNIHVLLQFHLARKPNAHFPLLVIIQGISSAHTRTLLLLDAAPIAPSAQYAGRQTAHIWHACVACVRVGTCIQSVQCVCEWYEEFTSFNLGVSRCTINLQEKKSAQSSNNSC